MTTPPSAMESTAPQPARMSAVGRMTGVLFSPKATFEDIAAKPGFVLPLAIIVVLTLAIVAVFGQRVGWRTFMEQQFAKSPQTANLSAEEKEQRMSTAVKIAPIIGYVQAVIAVPIAALIIGAVLMGVFNLIAGARVTFAQALSIVSYSWVPGIIGGVIGLILLFIKAPETIDLEHLVASDVGAFLSGDSPKWLMSLCTSLNLFTFWEIVLMGIGFSAASPKKVSIGKGITIIVACWALYVLAKVGWVGAFS
jgi:Yip1 domain